MKHGTLHAYANLRCRCEACRERWNTRSRSRNRAIAELIRRHDEEFRQLWDAEITRDEVAAASGDAGGGGDEPGAWSRR